MLYIILKYNLYLLHISLEYLIVIGPLQHSVFWYVYKWHQTE